MRPLEGLLQQLQLLFGEDRSMTALSFRLETEKFRAVRSWDFHCMDEEKNKGGKVKPIDFGLKSTSINLLK